MENLVDTKRKEDIRLKTRAEQPPKYKLAIIAWLAIYPAITLIFTVFEKWLLLLPIPARTFLLTIVLVPFMIYVGMPLLSTWLKDWLDT